ncbi:hypothetical protein GGR55DRAFT_676746 [Xylaria sp. FL0064]|nr:hypothetical protein GGR55DRAFT_676746 [Xylaria sp. FL0064]
MSLGEDWKAASKNAQRNPSAGKNRHKLTGKVPGLLSPAGLLAVLILAYPDVKKYQTRIKQLGIQWMIQRRDRLRVQRGFWKGITNSDLYSIFEAEEEPPIDDLDDCTPYILNKPDGVGLHDKTAMFTKPSTSLEADAGTHEDTDTEADGNADAELSMNEQASISYSPDVSETAHDIQRLSMVLNPVCSKVETDLMNWLMARPCAEEVLLPWCRFWADMHDQALSYDEQIVTRSLFLQSLRRLESIQASDFSDAAESYMLQDMEDVRETPFTPGSGALEELKQSQGYVAWEAMCAQLMQHVDRACAGDLTMLLDQQICFFRKIQAHKIFSSYTEDIITLNRLRARGFLYVKHSEGEEERSYRRRLLDNRAALWLTNWQLRAIVMPGHNDVLTPEQASIYEGKVVSSSGNSFTYTVPPQPTIPLDIPVDRDQIDVMLGYELLRKLFGKIPPPGSIPATSSTSDATERPTPAKAGQSRAMQFESTNIRRLDDIVNK